MNRIVNGVRVNTKKKEISNFNILEVEVGTTGSCGGDSGNGGRTYFALRDLGSTDLEVEVKNDGELDYNTEVIIKLGGDSELETFVEALEFAIIELKCRIYEEEMKTKINNRIRK